MGSQSSKAIENSPSAPQHNELMILQELFSVGEIEQHTINPSSSNNPIPTVIIDNYEVEFSMDLTCHGLQLNDMSLSVFRNYYYDYKGDGNLKALIAILIGFCSFQCFKSHVLDEKAIFSFSRSDRVNAVLQGILKDGGHPIRPGVIQSDSFQWMLLNGSVTISYRLYIRSTRSQGIPLTTIIKGIPSKIAKNLFLEVIPTMGGPMYVCSPEITSNTNPPFNPNYQEPENEQTRIMLPEA